MSRRVEDPHWSVQFVIGLTAILVVYAAVFIVILLVKAIVQLGVTALVAIPLVVMGIPIILVACRILGLLIIRRLEDHYHEYE